MAAVGCSEVEPGTASPSSGASRVPTTSFVEDRRKLDSVDPCSLIDDSELNRLGNFEDGREGVRKDGGRQCSWRGVRESASAERPLSLYIVLRDGSGVDDLSDIGSGTRSGVTEDTGRRVKETWNKGGCVVGLELRPNARVDAIATAPDTVKACDTANELVKLIDRKFPVE